MFRLILTFAANALGIYLASIFINGFELEGAYIGLALATLALTIINWLIRPIVRFVFGPIIFITLGLFSIVINMAMLWLLDLVSPAVSIANLLSLFLSALIIGLANLLVKPVTTKNK